MEKGDRFKPLGMQGFKKVSDYFIDEKFSLIEKKKARLLISDNKVVCIIGVRLDERFKLVENSKKYILYNYKNIFNEKIPFFIIVTCYFLFIFSN